ncbi:MAG TPA: hypothetical protein VM450_03880 [Thermomicrobiales bacterium]|nr:hypothetical protein [Thermomicrobiales bacterium]
MGPSDQRLSRPYALMLGLTMLLATFAIVTEPVTTAQVERDGPSAKYTVIVNLCLAPGCTQQASAIAPADGVAVTVSDYDTGEVFSSCVTGADAPGTCTVDIRLVETLAFTFDETTLPEGYRFDANPQIVPNQVTEPAAHAELPVLLYPVNGFPPDATAPTVIPPAGTPTPPASVPPPTAEPAGAMTAGLYAATCADGGPGERIAKLNGPMLPEGAQQGATDAIPVLIGYTVIDVPFRDMLNGGIVIAVVDDANPETMVACGPVGGILDGNGALSVGLGPVGDSGMAGVAFLNAQQDATATGISLFVLQVPQIVPGTPAS